MNYSDYRFTLDVQIHQSQVSVPVTFGDSARRLCIGLTDGRKPYTIEDGCRAVFNAKKPDGSTIKNDCIIERNTILYEFTEQTTSVEGVVNCDITIYDTDGKVLTSPQFIIVVDKRAVRDGEVPLSESESTTLDKIITSEQERQATFEANEAMRQDVWGMDGGIIIGDALAVNAEVTWSRSEDDTDTLLLTIPHKLAFRYPNCTVDALDWDAIKANISDCIAIEDDAATIKIDGYAKRLVFNKKDSKLYIRSQNEIIPHDIVLIVNGYGTPCGGELMRFIHNKYFNDLETDVSNLKEKSKSVSQDIDVEQAGFYLGNSDVDYAVTWENDGNGILKITIPNYFRFRYGNVGNDVKNWESIITDQIKNKVEIDEVDKAKITITIAGWGSLLVFNTIDGKLHIRNKSDPKNPEDIVLMVNGYGTPCGGELMRFIDLGRIMNLEADVSDLKENSKSVSQDIAVEQAGFYFGSSASEYAVTWENAKNGILKITIPHYFRFRYDGNAVEPSDWDSITKNISDKVVIDKKKITITIAGWGKLLVFNIADKQLYIRTQKDKNPNDIVLMVNGYGTPCGGELMRFIDLGRIMNLEADVKVIKNKLLTEDTARKKVEDFAALFKGTEKVEPFLFFTDPHLTQFPGDDWRSEFNTYMDSLANVYNEAPVERVFCGGDWLGEREYDAEACYRLGLIDSTMRKNFKNYHLIVGNHDTNYQGCADDKEEQTKENMYTTKLSNSTIANLWARNTKKLYYKVESANTDFYVLDTNAPTKDEGGIYNTAYMTEQLKWLAQELSKNTRDNIAIMSHIMITASGTIDGVVQNLPAIIEAFNNRNTVSVGGEEFDFSNAVGKIKFCMCGHRHVDGIYSAGGVPVVMTTQLRDGGTPTYDLCLANYDTNKLHLVRIGTGEDRAVTMTETK